MESKLDKSLEQLKKNDSSLKELSLIYSINENDLYRLMEAMRHNTQLETLVLTHNSITHKYAEHLSTILKTKKNLKILNLYDNELKAEGARTITEALNKKYKHSLSVLDLGHNHIESIKEICEALKANNSLTELNLSSNPLYSSVRHFGDVLKTNTNLTKLSLNFCEIGYCYDHEPGTKGLCEGLANNSTLTILELRSNRLEDTSASYLAKALKLNTGLEVLDIGSNLFTETGLSLLSEALKTNTTLRSLSGTDDSWSPWLVDTFQHNYTLFKLDGISNKKINVFLKRNKDLTEILKPLNDVLKKGELLKDKKTIEGILNSLETLLPNLNSLLENSYPRKAHHLLSTLKTGTKKEINDARQLFLTREKYTPTTTKPTFFKGGDFSVNNGKGENTRQSKMI